MAAAAVVIAVLALAWRSGGTRSPAGPDMGNAGNAGAPSGLSTRGPDISQMSPRERFDRLFDRVIRAAEGGDTTTVIQFTPMALGAYEQLDEVNNDARYHAAMLRLAVGDLAGASALADTIQAQAPGHFFAQLVRGEVAERTNDLTALNAAYRAFLDAWDAEMRAGRTEYGEHQPILDDFRTRARAALGR